MSEHIVSDKNSEPASPLGSSIRRRSFAFIHLLLAVGGIAGLAYAWLGLQDAIRVIGAQILDQKERDKKAESTRRARSKSRQKNTKKPADQIREAVDCHSERKRYLEESNQRLEKLQSERSAMTFQRTWIIAVSAIALVSRRWKSVQSKHRWRMVMSHPLPGRATSSQSEALVFPAS